MLHTKQEPQNLQTEQHIQDFIQDKLLQSKQNKNKFDLDDQISIHSHMISKTTHFESIPLLSCADQLQIKHCRNQITFDTLVQKYLEDPTQDHFMKTEMLKYLNLSKKRLQYAQTNGTTCSAICTRCLQLFANEHKVQKHQNREKKHCTTAQFLLKVISCSPIFKALIMSSNTKIENFTNYNFLIYSLSTNPTFQPMVETTKQGISGQLVLAVAQQFAALTPNMILHFVEDIPVTYQDIHRFLSGISFDISHPSAKYFESFNAQNKWIEGTHIEMIRTLIYSHGFFTNNNKTKPILITPSFYPLICTHTFDACRWLKSCLRKQHLMIDNQILPSTFLVPANIDENTHWILIYTNISTKTFFPINPYHPFNPNKNDIEVGMKIAASFSAFFKLGQLTYEAPAIVYNFPSQHDTYNCGIYVIIYSLAFLEENSNVKEKLHKHSIDAFRLIIVAWLMTKAIPYLP